ncbi:MAG: DegT/DnrJ/EryC1/StrS family aminotransferase [Flavobacteriaceae bacterium]|nr:DegT/DnrJ/EryC1/StrS family aminotransferase [Flavobacteriaceae bacterium]
MQHITKKPTNLNAFKHSYKPFTKARHAWQNILEAYKEKYPDYTVILPSYIGWSINEGSGIFDPVSNTDTPYKFYELSKTLRINVDDLKKVIVSSTNPIVILVHYFGFPDEKYNEIVSWLDDNSVYYVEDSAHAMLSDLIGGICGGNGAYNIYSLHKMLPYKDGGFLIDNHKNSLDIKMDDTADLSLIFSYDLRKIYEIRRRNYQFLIDNISDIKGITILYPNLAEGLCPQTLPIILDNYNRDEVYHELNSQGFGLVSLYHTMIDPLKNSKYECATYTSFQITNLPVHQDCTIENLDKMIIALKNILK